MKKKKGSGFKAGTPLNTQDVARLSGTSRRVLEYYEKTGMLVPRHASESIKSKRQWSIEQAKITDYIRVLQHGNMSIEDIAALADEGYEELLQTHNAQCARDIRTARRQTKGAVKDMRRCRGAARIGHFESFYLRRFPQRWLALMPLSGTDGQLPDPSVCSSAYVDLYSVAQVVGWASTGGSGVMASVSEGQEGALSAYAYIELASPPMPHPGEGGLEDGGCYQSIAEEGAPCPCAGNCDFCSHFGRVPTTEERFRWNAQEADDARLSDNVLMERDMAVPYAYGIWSGQGTSAADACSLETLRPRLMPHAVRLPLGITACALPQGAYLCCQCKEDAEDETLQRLIGAMMTIPHRAFTAQDERALHEACAGRPQLAADDEPAKPFESLVSLAGTMNISAGGTAHMLEAADLHKLVMPMGMGLPPENGYCISYSTLPTGDRNHPPRLELRVLVDASGLGSGASGEDAFMPLWLDDASAAS